VECLLGGLGEHEVGVDASPDQARELRRLPSIRFDRKN
jgi:hypothetical protein